MAVSFNGTTDLIDMGNTVGGPFAANAPMSVVCWVNFASLAGTQVPVGGGFGGTNTAYSFQSIAGTPNTLFWGSFDGANHGVTWSPATWSTSAWHHIYGDYDGATWHLYIDGVSVGSATTTGPLTGGRDFTIGCVNTSGAPANVQFFAGCAADVAVFSGPLTPTEITNLGTGTLRPNTGMSKTLLGYWNLDTVGASQTDLSGNSNTGTYTGTTPSLCGTSPPYVASTFVLMGQICA